MIGMPVSMMILPMPENMVPTIVLVQAREGRTLSPLMRARTGPTFRPPHRVRPVTLILEAAYVKCLPARIVAGMKPHGVALRNSADVVGLPELYSQ